MATLPWIIVVGIITQCYSASLSSMLTVQRFVPDISDIETLKTSNAMIGYTAKSFMANYLVDVLHFNNRNIKSYSTIEDYARALRSGEVAAVFLEVPVAKLFLAKYCNGFMIAGPTYSVGGYGYAFPRGSPMVPDIDEAIFKLSESGTMRNLENIMIGSETCENEATDLEDNSLSLTNFWVLLVFTVSMSTAALVVYHVRNRINILGMSMSESTRVWIIIFIVLKYWHHQQISFSARRTDREENPTTSPNIPESSAVNV